MIDDGDSQRVRPLVLSVALIALFAAASLGTAALGGESEASNFCKTYGLLPDDPVDVDGRLVHLGWNADERGQCGSPFGHYPGFGDAELVLWDDCMVSTPDGDLFPAVFADLDAYC
ncbi:MAG: hypothetical protein ACE367_18600 [Acidimicrobiales bacterium]